MMENSKYGKVILVGAGPGDPELLTIKAYKALVSSEVLLYDALVGDGIIELATSAQKIFVGKRKGFCAYTQDQINNLIVKFSKQGKTVVRLKGGDPFVFGRGFEEKLLAEKHGVHVEVIPGISSSLSVPAMANVPVTLRGASESFWVITGTTKKHELSSDIYDAAKSKATVVILMGMSKLAEICEIYRNEGKENLPVAIIQNGTRENEKILVSTIDQVKEQVDHEGLSNPAIIVIGEVAAHARSQKQFVMQFVTAAA